MPELGFRVKRALLKTVQKASDMNTYKPSNKRSSTSCHDKGSRAAAAPRIWRLMATATPKPSKPCTPDQPGGLVTKGV